MAKKGDHRSNLFRLFTRSRRTTRPPRARGASAPSGTGHITDALGATRAMRPQVVRPRGGEAAAPASDGPELTVIHPPSKKGRASEPHLQVSERRLRFSLSYLACGTLAVAFGLLLLVAFVVGMKYRGGQRRAPGMARDGQGPPGKDGSKGKQPVIVQIPPRVVGPLPATATTRYRLRIAVYTPSKRDLARKSVAVLREKGVWAVLVPRRIDGKEKLVIYSEQHFSSGSSPEAAAFERKVEMITHKGRRDFDSAYYVPVE